MGKHIHIISFDIPYPANYGGVIDIYNSIRLLNKEGMEITLHCFQYRGKKESPELEKLCKKVFYYKRKTGLCSNLSLLPYIVKSRKDKNLLKNLLSDSDPILFEGKHSCYYLNDERLNDRLKIYRPSNIEYDYYTGLAKAEKSLWKRFYFSIEAQKLKRFQKQLKYADVIMSVSEYDTDYFKAMFPNKKVEHFMPFHSYDAFDIETGKGDYVLYHGKLSVPENENAVTYLVKEVFSKEKDLPFIIAGHEPSQALKNLIEEHTNVTLIESPNDEELKKLIQNAAVNLLYTSQPTGVKLKLISVLFNGRNCVVNDKMLEGIGLENVCIVANTPPEIADKCRKLLNIPFTEEDKQQRIEKMRDKFSNREGLKRFLRLLED